MNDLATTVFVVDDELSVRQALVRLLRLARLNVAAFSSAEAFLECYDPGTPGCLVLDLAMPGLNGLELQEALTGRGSSLPIIFLTGHGDLPSGVMAMKRGAVDFLTKPADANDLIETVRGAIEKDRVSRQTRAELTEIQRRFATPHATRARSPLPGRLWQAKQANCGRSGHNGENDQSPSCASDGKGKGRIAGRTGDARAAGKDSAVPAYVRQSSLP